LADELTDIARKENIRAITSQRAYYFWEGCETIYDTLMSYSANFEKRYYIRRSKIEMIKVLLGLGDSDSYHILPTMYTTSLFHFSLIEEAIKKQQGRLITFTIPDANLAALCVSFEKRYIKSMIPLGWVGTSPASIFRDDTVLNFLKRLPERCGDYSLGSWEIYFWGALTSISSICDDKKDRLVSSKLFISLMFAGVLFSLRKLKDGDYVRKKKMLEAVADINTCSWSLITFLFFVYKIIHLIYVKYKRILHKFCISTYNVSKSIKPYETPYFTLTEVSDMVIDMTRRFLNRSK
jgi:hypothetical protein